MKRRIPFALVFMLFPLLLQAQTDFGTSLHATRSGMQLWYSSGFFQLTGVPYGSLSCGNCHGPVNADGEEYGATYAPGCVDCHPSGNFDKNALSEVQCLGCHSRQGAEMALSQYEDVHREHGMKCWDCHRASEIHGDGTSYSSILEAGAIKTDCGDCHATLPPEHAQYDPHRGALHCNACHSASVISCYSCHFESEVRAGVKRPQQLLHGFVLLLNRSKDGRVGTGTFQSLTYNGSSFTAIAPYHSHLVTEEGRRCADCHHNMGQGVDAIAEYNSTGSMTLARWNAADSTLSWLRGVIPVPADYAGSMRMDFLTYSGDVHDAVGDGRNWRVVAREWDAQHLLFGSALTAGQMASLGFLPVGTDTPPSPAEQLQLDITPHPVRDEALLRFRLPAGDMTSLRLYDRAGRLLRTLSSSMMEAGSHRLRIVLNDLPAGLYYCRLDAGSLHAVRKLLLLR